MNKESGMTKAKGTAVASANSTDVAGFDYGDRAGSGYEGVSGEDLSVPFLKILQANSPETDEVPGAQSGMLFNTVTKKMTPGAKGVGFIPCHCEFSYIEWV